MEIGSNGERKFNFKNLNFFNNRYLTRAIVFVDHMKGEKQYIQKEP